MRCGLAMLVIPSNSGIALVWRTIAYQRPAEGESTMSTSGALPRDEQASQTKRPGLTRPLSRKRLHPAVDWDQPIQFK